MLSVHRVLFYVEGYKGGKMVFSGVQRSIPGQPTSLVPMVCLR